MPGPRCFVAVNPHLEYSNLPIMLRTALPSGRRTLDRCNKITKSTQWLASHRLSQIHRVIDSRWFFLFATIMLVLMLTKDMLEILRGLQRFRSEYQTKYSRLRYCCSSRLGKQDCERAYSSAARSDTSNLTGGLHACSSNCGKGHTL